MIAFIMWLLCGYGVYQWIQPDTFWTWCLSLILWAVAWFVVRVVIVGFFDIIGAIVN